MNKNKGITLVALVITVVILIILAGVALKFAFDGGIITQAKDSTNQYEEGKRNDLDFLAQQEKEQDEVYGKEPDPLPPPAGEPTSTEFSRRYGVIDIVWLDLNNKVITKPLPIGATELCGLVPVKWAGIPGSYTEQTGVQNDPSSLTDWYEYIAGTGNNDNNNSIWANAKTSDGNAYFVWIPRYGYKITYFDTQAHANDYRADSTSMTGIVGYSNIFGFVNASDQLLIGSEPTNVTGKVKTVAYSDYIPHPAFEFDGAKKGIWVGKYESSGSETTVIIKPNTTTSSLITNVRTMFPASQGVKVTYTLNGDTHMMKNIEWGAVAYLTESKFGRNGTEIYINNSSSYVTGSSGGSTNASSASGTPNYAYDTPNGVLASTTGNIYGIYDMSGGAFEYVAAYIDNGNSMLGTWSAPILNNNKYADIYKATNDTQVKNYEESMGMKGDAVYETSTSHTGSTSWYNNFSAFPSSSTAVFLRSRCIQWRFKCRVILFFQRLSDIGANLPIMVSELS